LRRENEIFIESGDQAGVKSSTPTPALVNYVRFEPSGFIVKIPLKPHAAANTGDTAGALENYAKADRIIDNLRREFPDQIEFKGLKRNLHTKMGEVFQRGGNPEETRKNFLAAVDLSREMVDAEPENPTHLSALGQAYILYGETLPLGLNENQSVAVASKGLPFLEKALIITPNESVPLQRMNMANIHIGLQLCSLAREAEESGDLNKVVELYEQASEQFQKAKETAEKLTTLDGKNAGFHRRLYASKFDESIALSGLGKTGEALQIQREILAETEKSSKDALNAEAQFDLAQVYYETGRTFARRREFSGAIANMRKAVALYDKIIEKDAQNSEVQSYKFEAQLKLGDAIFEQGNQPEAIEIYRAALAEARTAPKLKDTPYVGFAEGWTHEKIGDLYAGKNQMQISCGEYQKTLENWRAPQTSPVNFGFSAEKFERLQQKTARCGEL